jgi:hypothetical protein
MSRTRPEEKQRIEGQSNKGLLLATSLGGLGTYVKAGAKRPSGVTERNHHRSTLASSLARALLAGELLARNQLASQLGSCLYWFERYDQDGVSGTGRLQLPIRHYVLVLVGYCEVEREQATYFPPSFSDSPNPCMKFTAEGS